LISLLAFGVFSVVLVGFSSPTGAVPIPWRNCGSSESLISVSRAESTIWPPVAGQSITFDVQFVLRQDINGVFADLQVSAQPPLVLPVWPFKIDLGRVNAGPYIQVVTVMVPLGAGGETFNVSLEAYDTRGDPLVCVQATVPVKPAESTSFWQLINSPPPGVFLWEFFGNFLPMSEGAS